MLLPNPFNMKTVSNYEKEIILQKNQTLDLMKPLNRLNCLVAIFSLALVISCQKEMSYRNPGNNGGGGVVINPTPVQGNLAGKVVDNTNNAVAGATVKAGSKTTTTDSRGNFRFDNIQLDKYAALVTVEKAGFFKGYRVFSASANNTSFVKLKMIAKNLAGTVDAAAGGSVNLPDNSKITLPAGGVVMKSNNQAYTGSVKIYAAPIDPTSDDIAQIVPGSFMGNDINNSNVLLKSYGMLAVELEGNSGEQLQIANGKTAKLRFNIPASLRASAPATIPLWSVDEATGIWDQEGTATKGSDYYEGDVSHFSFWNCDINIPTVYLELTVTTTKGAIPFTQVRITRTNGGGASYGYTDSSGHVGGIVPKNEALLLEIFSSCNQPIYSQNIGPYSANANLGTISVTIPSQNSLTISGSAVNCSNQPVTDGNALIYYDGVFYNKPITNGNFSMTITRCSNSSATVEVVAVDKAGQQQSTTWSGSAATGTVNTGALTACGTSSVSYINYSVDGNNYSISTANPGDSLMTWGNSGSQQSSTSVSGFKFNQPTTHINFYTQGAAAGTFPLQFLSVNQLDSVNLVTPFNITFTAYGTQGQFIEGNFSGQVREIANNNLHNVSATFRVRRN